jgi:hypothetical protein
MTIGTFFCSKRYIFLYCILRECLQVTLVTFNTGGERPE